MNPNITTIYSRLKEISQNVKKELRKKGIATAKVNEDGSISVGKFKIVKHTGFYAIEDYSGEVRYDRINLAQTAAVVANDLAVKHFADIKFLDLDRKYGFAAFEETYYKQLSMKKSIEKEVREIQLCKANEARVRKDLYKHEIEQGYEKLIRMR
ncbi:MAG: hypothetical protein EBU90_25425 [Proteobacteria bacterium]|nr:hypothetical protein [Pseudomonadota bacterium]NBP16382.1 hypothetical protein [bacterium]